LSAVHGRGLGDDALDGDGRAPLDVAWKYWTNIEKWIQPPMHWVIREVHGPETATIEPQLDGANLSFERRFAGLTDGRTRLTQRVELWRKNAGNLYNPTRRNSSGDYLRE